LNAAPVLYISGIVDDLKQGVEKSREIIDSGLAMKKLRQWVKVQNRDADAGASRIESLLEQIN
ncbi:MAG: anthranilate phosphoribosyltransferase, partial [bacterium]|nr:anthranilate phosphoribosyltransferase [bacterium]